MTFKTMFSVWAVFMTFIFLCHSNHLNEPEICSQSCGTSPDVALRLNPTMLKSKVRKIFSGDVVKENLYPWIVRVEMSSKDYEKKYICGGTLISQTHVLTAAHCMISNFKQKCKFTGGKLGVCLFEPEEVKVTFASSLLVDLKARAYGVKTIDVHEEMLMENDYVRHDVALLELEEPAPCNASAVPICLPDKWREPEGDIIEAGYGMDWEYADVYDPERPLQEGTVTLLERSVCKVFSNDTRPEEEIFCSTGKETKQRSCVADSGSGIFTLFPQGYFLLAVISGTGLPDCTWNDTQNDVDVSAHMKWIQDHVSNIPQPSDGENPAQNVSRLAIFPSLKFPLFKRPTRTPTKVVQKSEKQKAGRKGISFSKFSRIQRM